MAKSIPVRKPPQDPMRRIAVGVIHQAVKDLKYGQYRYSALQFFRGTWFPTLAAIVDLDVDAALEALEI